MDKSDVCRLIDYQIAESYRYFTYNDERLTKKFGAGEEKRVTDELARLMFDGSNCYICNLLKLKKDIC